VRGEAVTHGFLFTAVIFLLAAVVAVPISKKLGFGSVLGYLVAGILIGPSGFKLITSVEDILHFSEFGVVLLLFLIGLELEPRKLWQMRFPIFGLGGLQVTACLAAFTAAGFTFGLPLNVAVILGMGFCLSSTAMALQILNERKILGTEAGKGAFSILLFQDIAVIAMIALVPLLGVRAAADSEGGGWAPVRLLGVFVGVLVAGRIFLRPILRWIAGVRMREVFTALALLLVVGMAALMQAMNLSMALGAFVAGLLLADSEYRHALETDIEPFKGLLLGLFFIAVGMSIDFGVLLQSPGLVSWALSVRRPPITVTPSKRLSVRMACASVAT
jgi:glutathione-regulated potassium-efflux system ancillary protein KefC